jgi:hypothetical protein
MSISNRHLTACGEVWRRSTYSFASNKPKMDRRKKIKFSHKNLILVKEDMVLDEWAVL